MPSSSFVQSTSLSLLSELSISPGLLAAGIGSGSTRFLLALTFLVLFFWAILACKKTYHHASAQILTHGHQSPTPSPGHHHYGLGVLSGEELDH
ncbi:hypothetical protein GBAR_LOCUS24100 [Geodia barretti]|uniref:Uncharacterized protein n=1 Tax=Geodia barretti TaxID=519541 RepID=A0AA35X8J1_GEOBA|nr:hypothetical protein GBAR_LOCUS24100 [Geodia barretti]